MGFSKMNCVKLLVAATALGMATQSYAATKLDSGRTISSPRVTYVDKITGQFHDVLRCGFENPSAAERITIESKLRQFRSSDRASLVQGVAVADRVIPVQFQVLLTNAGAGDVTDKMLADQIAMLNSSYAGSGFQFTLKGTKRTRNTTWYNTCDKATVERQIRQALAVDPAHTFNVYLCGLGGGLLGRATFPSYYPEGSYMHGVVILNQSVPGGSVTNYNNGRTLVHEAGHYLGLYHTFQGGCSAPGDYVSDTPQEKAPAFGLCPVQDTCPLDPGNDPTNNYMDYSYDTCLNNFTAQQKLRAQDQVSIYKPSLGH